MPNDDGIEHMTQACLAAHEAVQEHGSPELQALSRLLLFTLGREMAARTETDVQIEAEA